MACWGAKAPFELPVDAEADNLLEESIWERPSSSVPGGKSLFKRRLGIVTNLMHARRRYKVFYDNRFFQMIVAYVMMYLFGGEE